MEGIHVVGAVPGVLGDGSPQKMKQNLKLAYNFNVFLYKI